VVAVCAIVSTDFATSVIPGWHTTIFPPYFLSGAIFCGFALVTLLLLVTRKAMRLEEYVTGQHLNWLCKVLLLGSFVIGIVYATEFFVAWYSANPYELATFVDRATGAYAGVYWTMVVCNVLAPQVLWSRRARRTPWIIGTVATLVVIGMWCERFVIVVTSLHRDYLPSSWAYYLPSANEVAILVGMFGLFFSLYLLFTRLLPVIPMAEIKGVLDYARRPADTRGEHPDFTTESTEDTERRHRVRSVSGSPLRALSVFSVVNHKAHGTRSTIGYFECEEDLLRAVREARRRGFAIVEAFCPYPVHGLAKELGLGPSRLPWVAFGAGALALAFILALQIWTSAHDWPLRVGGQPMNAGIVWVPVAIMVTMLVASFTGVGVLFLRTRLWPGKAARALPGVTDDRFALMLLEADAATDEAEIGRVLRASGAVRVDEGDEP
jgi:molybdopterin-containing oxidoreductase family membrane subunit